MLNVLLNDNSLQLLAQDDSALWDILFQKFKGVQIGVAETVSRIFVKACTLILHDHLTHLIRWPLILQD